jgi:predicted  nucleic acid-binding Zn-ribbon protein
MTDLSDPERSLDDLAARVDALERAVAELRHALDDADTRLERLEHQLVLFATRLDPDAS